MASVGARLHSGSEGRSPSGADEIFSFQRLNISAENHHIILKHVDYMSSV